eukprot:jgi/Bigna1/91686/estExt_fgenesh1_pg.C_1130023
MHVREEGVTLISTSLCLSLYRAVWADTLTPDEGWWSTADSRWRKCRLGKEGGGVADGRCKSGGDREGITQARVPAVPPAASSSFESALEASANQDRTSLKQKDRPGEATQTWLTTEGGIEAEFQGDGSSEGGGAPEWFPHIHALEEETMGRDRRRDDSREPRRKRQRHDERDRRDSRDSRRRRESRDEVENRGNRRDPEPTKEDEEEDPLVKMKMMGADDDDALMPLKAKKDRKKHKKKDKKKKKKKKKKQSGKKTKAGSGNSSDDNDDEESDHDDGKGDSHAADSVTEKNDEKTKGQESPSSKIGKKKSSEEEAQEGGSKSEEKAKDDNQKQLKKKKKGVQLHSPRRRMKTQIDLLSKPSNFYRREWLLRQHKPMSAFATASIILGAAMAKPPHAECSEGTDCCESLSGKYRVPKWARLPTHRRAIFEGSRQHAAVVHDKHGRIQLIDLKSGHGVRVNRKRIKPNYPKRLREFDVVTFGGSSRSYECQYRSSEGKGSRSGAKDDDSDDESLHFSNDDDDDEELRRKRKQQRREKEKVRCSHLLVKHRNSSRSSSSSSSGTKADSRRPSSWRQQKITISEEEAVEKVMEFRGRILKSGYKMAEAFAELATKYSDCSSARAGGDLGFFTRKKMQKPFEDASFALQIGELSQAVRTESGVHIILRTG